VIAFVARLRASEVEAESGDRSTRRRGRQSEVDDSVIPRLPVNSRADESLDAA
jgi:hypothetical protein